MYETNISGTPIKEQKTMTKIHKLIQIPIKYRQLQLRVIRDFLIFFKIRFWKTTEHIEGHIGVKIEK